MDGKRKVSVRLTAEQREHFESVTRTGSGPARRIVHARVLLMADAEHPLGRYTDQQIAQALGLHVNTVARVRQAFARGGEGSIDRKQRTSPPVAPKMDGTAEAHLITLCCSKPPEGRRRWTMTLLADEMVKRKMVVSIGREAVRRTLEKNRLRPWMVQRFCIPERDRARFVAQMEVVLDTYALPRDEQVPLIAMDEACKALHADVSAPLPMKPGAPLRQDDKYERHGTSAVFLFFAPHLGWRRATCSTQRTRVDFAREIKTLLTKDFPNATQVRLVCDNLNTHSIASLYEAFEPAEAHALARRLEFVYTPRNGSWLNVAEIELAALSEQCTRRRIADQSTLASELSAWSDRRNADHATAHWHFTTDDARIKLRTLYPQV